MLSSLFGDDDHSESDNLMILSPKCTEKNIAAQQQTTAKSRGIKRKSYLEDGDDNESILPFSPKKKLKISPSKMKTKKKEKSTESSGDGFKLDIAQDSESQSDSE